MGEEEVAFRIVLIGNTEVGKTSLVTTLMRGMFVDQKRNTVGAVFNLYEKIFEGKKYTVQIWDTAGQEKYRSLGPLYYRDANAAIAVCDVTHQDSLEDLDRWISDFRANTTGAKLFIVGNKIDQEESIEVTSDRLAEFAQNNQADWYETSAKTTENVQEMFDGVISMLIRTITPEIFHMNSESKPKIQPKLINKACNC